MDVPGGGSLQLTESQYLSNTAMSSELKALLSFLCNLIIQLTAAASMKLAAAESILRLHQKSTSDHFQEGLLNSHIF